jgi:hypothetical protein
MDGERGLGGGERMKASANQLSIIGSRSCVCVWKKEEREYWPTEVDKYRSCRSHRTRSSSIKEI